MKNQFLAWIKALKSSPVTGQEMWRKAYAFGLNGGKLEEIDGTLAVYRYRGRIYGIKLGEGGVCD